jgi:hypothetical protein
MAPPKSELRALLAALDFKKQNHQFAPFMAYISTGEWTLRAQATTAVKKRGFHNAEFSGLA